MTIKTEWTDGTTHLLFEPVELLERLAALTPRPRIDLTLHRGVLAPHSRWRARAVAYGRESPAPDAEPAAVLTPAPAPVTPPPASMPPDQEPAPAAQEWPASRSPARAWAQLLRHTFAVDVLDCPRCGGRVRVIATIEDPVVIRKILTHLGLPTEIPPPWPPPSDLFGWN